MNEQNRPSYYAIIPATVRYDERLKYAERLLYGEITSLIGKDGYCFASNSYFSKLYGVIPGTVSRWISHLSNLGYIKEEIIRDTNKQIVERRLYITDISCRRLAESTYEQFCSYPYKQNNTYPISKKDKDNNKDINIKIDRLFNYIIYKKGEIPEDFENEEHFNKFYSIIERLEFNYTEHSINIIKNESLDKIKCILYCIKDLYINNKMDILSKIKREEYIETYNNCKNFEKKYEGTKDKIINFQWYYYASIVKKFKDKEKII